MTAGAVAGESAASSTPIPAATSSAPATPIPAVTPSAPAAVGRAAGGKVSTLADVLSDRVNTFGFLRLVLASLVIVDHAFPLSGSGADPFWGYTLGQESLGGFAVAGFFVVSGFLITRSAMTVDFLGFLWRRILRIFPAFWLVLFVTVAAVGPLFYWLDHGSLAGYATRGFPGPITYLTHNMTLTIGQYGLLDVFATTPYGREVGWSVMNGSLWTLEYEWRCYLIVGLMSFAAVFARARVLVPIIAILLTVAGSVADTQKAVLGQMAPWLGDPHSVRLTALFLLGATAAVYADRVPLDARLATAAAIVTVVTLFVSGGYHLVGVIALAYALLWFAYRGPRALARVGAVNDYSYGIYVYGFLIQMALAQLGVHHWGLFLYIVIAWLVTFVFAWISWHAVEKRALRLKSWGPGKGWKIFDRLRPSAAVSRGGDAAV